MTQSIDLHSHSTASDGALSPTDLILRAHMKGVKVLSLTDHDTIDGLTEAIAAANTLGIELVKGIEISCLWNGITIHVLGYGFDVDNTRLQELLAFLREARWSRAKQIAEKLHTKGMVNLLDKAISQQQQQFASNNGPGRPHFARAMVAEGYVDTTKEAFQKWLGNGKIGDVKQHWPSLETVVDILHKSGAWVSLAHPCQYNMTRTKLCRLLREFIASGGHAMEVVNGFQPAEQVGKLANLVRDFGLLASAGSDFHYPNSWGELGLYRSMPEDLPPLWKKLGVLH